MYDVKQVVASEKHIHKVTHDGRIELRDCA